jgi:2EXR family
VTKIIQDYQFSVEIKSPGENVPRIVGRPQTELPAGTVKARVERLQHISGHISILPTDMIPPSLKGKIEEGAELFEDDIAKFPLKSSQKSDASVAESKTLTKFRPFPRLPSELRLKIWKLNMPGPRVVELRYSKKIYHAVSPTPTPALLHVCREVSFLRLILCPSILRRIFTVVLKQSLRGKNLC